MSYKSDQESLPALRQRLFRLLWGAMALEQSTIKILERITLHNEPPAPEDVADVTDRLHELFNTFSFLTRIPTWHDDELEHSVEQD